MADSKNNTGTDNSGDYNSGNRNSGNYNSGYYNSGDYNSGYYNSGDYNSGYYNSGGYNSGDYNSGYYNSGDYNSGNRNSGYFNTDEPPVRLFGKFTDMTETQFRAKYGYANICPLLNEWIPESSMTEAEKKANPSYSNAGGYLKKHDYKDAWRTAWDKASKIDRGWFLNLPNFDAEIFLQITGIDVRKPQKESLSGKKVSVTYEDENGDVHTVTATID